MFTAWSPPTATARVLGVSLGIPLTLGHVLLLDEIGSPFVHLGPIESGDLAVAVFVCSRPAEVSRRDMDSFWLPLLMRWWGKRCAKLDWDAETETFCEWFVEHNNSPEAIRSGSGSGRISSPWWINRIAAAIGTLGLSEQEVLAMPSKRVAQYTAALAESDGRCELWKPDQESFWQAAHKLDLERGKAGRN